MAAIYELLEIKLLPSLILQVCFCILLGGLCTT